MESASKVKRKQKPGLLSSMTFSWVYPYMSAARSQRMTASDLDFYIERDYEPRQLSRRLSSYLQLYGADQLWKAIMFFLLPYYVISTLSEIVSVRVVSYRTQLVSSFSGDYEAAFKSGFQKADQVQMVLKAIYLSMVSMLPPLIEGYSYSRLFDMSIKLRMALSGVIVQRLFNSQIGQLSRQFLRSGRLANILSNDVQVLQDSSVIISIFYVIPTSIYEAVNSMVASNVLRDCMYGIAVMIAYAVIQTILALVLTRTMRRINECGDLRIRLSSELFTNLKTVKQLGLEGLIGKRIMDIRSQEKSALRLYLVMQTISECLHSLLLPLSQTAALVFRINQTASSNSSEQIVRIMELLAMLKDRVFTYIPNVVNLIPKMRNSLQRLSEYLSVPLKQPRSTGTVEDAYMIRAENARFCIEKNNGRRIPRKLQELLNIKDQRRSDAGNRSTAPLSLKLERGKRCLLTGASGSGKSTILEGLAGILELKSGGLCTATTISYCPQAPWIIQGSVRENIVAGRPFNKDLLAETIRQCDLMDVNAEKQCGERGSQLSGGQKQRIGLARLVYGRPELCILDDTVSALDPKCAAAILCRLFDAGTGLLSRSAVIIATANPQLVRDYCDMDCCVTIRSSDRIDTEYKRGLKRSTVDTAEYGKESAMGVKLAEARKEDTEQEYRVFSVLKSYVVLAGGVATTAAVILAFVAEQYLKKRQAATLSTYISSSTKAANEPVSAAEYLRLALLMAAAKISYSLLFTTLHGMAASKLHDAVLRRCGIRRLVPTGRILAYLTRDQRVVDMDLCTAITSLLGLLSVCVSAIVLCGSSSEPTVLLLCLLVVWIAGGLLQSLFSSGWRAARAEISHQNALLLDRINECCEGVAVIDGIADLDRLMLERSFENIASLGRSNFYLSTVRRWMTLRFEALKVLTRLAVDIVCIVFRLDPAVKIVAGDSIVSNAATFELLAKSMAEADSGLLSFNLLMRLATDGEGVADDAGSPDKRPPAGRSPSSACQHSIEMINVSMRYSSQDLVLDNISLVVARGEKVAVTGRTGAGKSSLLNALYRLEDGQREGAIIVDGVDTSTLSLRALRSRLLIVPQEAVVFYGTLRFNVDPAAGYTDAQVAGALAAAGLPRLALDACIDALGLSASQQTLVGLARALLRVTPDSILLLDEVSARADEAVLDSIGRAVGGLPCTVLAIMHRAYGQGVFQRTIVMEKGRIVPSAN